MRPRLLSDLAIMHLVADAGSFTAAAQKLGVTQSALSQSVKRLENELGVSLLSRTTRSLAPTEAGERLLGRLAPAITELDSEIDTLRALSAQPKGRLRVTCGKHAADTLVWPTLSELAADYPDIEFELNVENRHVDIFAERFDLGIRLHERLEMDMISVEVGPPMRAAVIASPSYLARHPAPQTPRDIPNHRCIGFRNAAGIVLPWELEKDGQTVASKIRPDLVVNDPDTLINAAAAGMGLAYVLADVAAAALKDGRVVQVLSDWCPPFPGYHAFYPSRHHPTRARSMFLALLRKNGGL